jgi:hypothetical protein
VIYLGVESVSRVQFSSELVQRVQNSSSEFGELQSSWVGIRRVAVELKSLEFGIVFGEEVRN